MTEKKISELGLAEFVAGLISETFEAISASMEDQVRRQSDLRAAAELTVSEYGQSFVSSAQVVDAAIELFSISQEANPILEGAEYVPPADGALESPAIFDVLGISLVEGEHYQSADNAFVFLAAGVEFINEAIREKLAMDQQDILQQMINSGIPKVVVDQGKILSRVSFNVVEDEEEPPQETEAVVPVANLPLKRSITSSKLEMLNRLGTNRSSLILPGVQFKVKQADADSSSTSTTSVYGEVEIQFRTIS